jgi:hypothetical protein
VGEIRVHLNDAVRATFERPSKARDVRGPQSHLARAVQDRASVGFPFVESIRDLSSVIPGIVVDDQNVQVGDPKRQKLMHDRFQVLRFVVRGENDECLHNGGRDYSIVNVKGQSYAKILDIR